MLKIFLIVSTKSGCCNLIVLRYIKFSPFYRDKIGDMLQNHRIYSFNQISINVSNAKMQSLKMNSYACLSAVVAFALSK